MPFYQDLKYQPKRYADAAIDNRWVCDRILDLRQKLRRIPERQLRGTLVLGTWNIRDFDDNKFGQGPRREESFHYIAEVLSRFDLCAVQEINDNLGPLQRVLRLMGPSYDYMVTDVTMGDSGNNERLAFVFDKRKILFRNIVGELVLPDQRGAGPIKQLARTPMLASFQAGWFKFTICTSHIYYGKDSRNSPEYKRRVGEIASIAKILAGRHDKENENYIFLGDFNVVDRRDDTFLALQDAGFVVPDNIHSSNMGLNKDYDQIALRVRKGQMRELSSGVFDWRSAVYRDEDFVKYQPVVTSKDEDGKPIDPDKAEKHYQSWRTWQMSDHLPIWVELEVDFSDDYLVAIRDTPPPA